MQAGSKPRAPQLRIAVGMALYGALLVASLATLSDWRIRLATVAVILLFAGRTLWQPRRTEAPRPFGREADLAPGRSEEEEV
ncbi:MAG TPA: hypothetical protein VMV31_04935 [Terriglobales bacterium]|nr:hypothetical protein [Terriglobales bacterium]